MSIKAWKILSSNYLLKRTNVAFRIDQCETKDGTIFEPYVIESGTWVNIIALTKKREVVMIKQYRHGVQQVLLEFPAGIMEEEDENPQRAAQRELLEETGYTSDQIIEIGRVYPNPATHTNLTYSFLAFNAEKVGQQELDATEDIEVDLIPLDELVLIVKQGGLPQALHITALFFALVYFENNGSAVFSGKEDFSRRKQ